MSPRLRARLQHAEAVLAGALRSPTARLVGTVVAVGALVALGSRLLGDPGSTRDAVRNVGPDGAALSLLGLLGFHVFAIRCLATLDLAPAAQIWSHAQLLKYLPVPASALAGFVGSAVQQGHRARQALRGLVLHTIVLVLGATVVASGLLVSHAERLGAVTVILILAGGAALVAGVTTGLVLRAGVPPKAFVHSLLAWATLGVGFGLGLGSDPTEWLDIGSAYAAAWVVGQLVVPVPAGLGVREAAFVILLTPTLGEAQALVAALLSRVLHALSDGSAAVIIGGWGRWRRTSSMEPDG